MTWTWNDPPSKGNREDKGLRSEAVWTRPQRPKKQRQDVSLGGHRRLPAGRGGWVGGLHSHTNPGPEALLTWPAASSSRPMRWVEGGSKSAISAAERKGGCATARSSAGLAKGPSCRLAAGRQGYIGRNPFIRQAARGAASHQHHALLRAHQLPRRRRRRRETAGGWWGGWGHFIDLSGTEITAWVGLGQRHQAVQQVQVAVGLFWAIVAQKDAQTRSKGIPGSGQTAPASSRVTCVAGVHKPITRGAGSRGGRDWRISAQPAYVGWGSDTRQVPAPPAAAIRPERSSEEGLPAAAAGARPPEVQAKEAGPMPPANAPCS
jgi:hypothetical protein